MRAVWQREGSWAGQGRALGPEGGLVSPLLADDAGTKEIGPASDFRRSFVHPPKNPPDRLRERQFPEWAKIFPSPSFPHFDLEVTPRFVMRDDARVTEKA